MGLGLETKNQTVCCCSLFVDVRPLLLRKAVGRESEHTHTHTHTHTHRGRAMSECRMPECADGAVHTIPLGVIRVQHSEMISAALNCYQEKEHNVLFR